MVKGKVLENTTSLKHINVLTTTSLQSEKARFSAG